eukprot:432878_1
MLEESITEKGKGKSDFNFEKGILQCEMNFQRNMNVAPKEEQKEALKIDCVKFNIEIIESRLCKDRYLEVEDQVYEIKESNEHLIFFVRVTITEGDTLVFNRLKNVFMLTYCSSIIKGLPDWARKLEKKENAVKYFDNED